MARVGRLFQRITKQIDSDWPAEGEADALPGVERMPTPGAQFDATHRAPREARAHTQLGLGEAAPEAGCAYLGTEACELLLVPPDCLGGKLGPGEMRNGVASHDRVMVAPCAYVAVSEPSPSGGPARRRAPTLPGAPE